MYVDIHKFIIIIVIVITVIRTRIAIRRRATNTQPLLASQAATMTHRCNDEVPEIELLCIREAENAATTITIVVAIFIVVMKIVVVRRSRR